MTDSIDNQAMTALDLAAGLFKFEQIIDYDYATSPNTVSMTLPNGRLIFLVSTGTRYVFALFDEDGNPTARYEGFIEDMADMVEVVIRKYGQ